jgi:geranylgeranyl diphosphate synthase type I
VHATRDFVLDGGKRLRPAFAYWGWRGAGGEDSDAAMAAAASLELLHACALVHDDVMDGSDTRRGQPAVHRRFAAMHRTERWHGDPDAFGHAAAILLGDMCLVWADLMLHTSGLPADALERGQHVFDTMRVELMAGQYLDVLEQARGSGTVERALRVARYKSAKYTIERPLHLGAALAGGDEDLGAAYTAYGVPLGEAFQLRDDVLGVFGDPSQTGKPAGDDLREGKSTVLVASALERATPGQTAAVHRLLGDPRLDGRESRRSARSSSDTGALDTVVADRQRDIPSRSLRARGRRTSPTRPTVLHVLAVAHCAPGLGARSVRTVTAHDRVVVVGAGLAACPRPLAHWPVPVGR